MWFKLFYANEYINLDHVISVEFSAEIQRATITFVSGRTKFIFAKNDIERLQQLLASKSGQRRG